MELNSLDKVVLPNSSTKKKLQLVNGQLSLVSFDGKIVPIGESKSIQTTIENKLDLNSLLIKHFDDRFNSLLPIVDSKATKDELVTVFEELSKTIKDDLTVLKDYTETLNSETKSSLNEKIDSNKSEIDLEIVELYQLNTSLSDDLTSMIDNLKLSNENDLTNVKLALSVEVQRLSDSLNNYKIYAEETFAKKSEIPFVPSLIEGKNIRLTENNEGNIVIDAIVPQFISSGGGISKTTVQEMIDGSSGNYVSKSGDTMTGSLVMSNASIDLDSSYTALYKEGRLFYDTATKTLAYYNEVNGITVNLGQEHLIRVKNNSGSIISNGSVCYINGSLGDNITCALAKADSPITSKSTIGICTNDIAINDFGYITRLGVVHGLDTHDFTAGDVLYLSPTVAGGLTNVEPIAPYRNVRVGYVSKKSSGDGHILVDVHIGQSLSELNDVSTVGISGSDVLVYSSITNTFTPKPIINGVNKSLSYDISSGKLSSLTSSLGNKIFTYNIDGQLTSISGSGLFKNKTFVYSSGKLIDIIVS